MTTEEINRMMRRTKEGDERAFEKIYRAYYGQMLYGAKLITRNEADAHDAVQNAWIKIWKYIKSKEEINLEYPVSYMATAARRCALDVLEKRKTQSESEYKEELNGTESKIEEKIGEGDILAAISELGESDREVAIAHFVYDMRMKDVSKQMNIPVGTIKWKIHEIRKRLSERLKETE